MQVFATILTLFFITLTVLPCTDESPAGCSAEVHFHTSQGHDHEQESHADFCSPFCSCHCCHNHFLVRDYNFHSTEIDKLGTFVPYLAHQYFLASTAIWQPPRV